VQQGDICPALLPLFQNALEASQPQQVSRRGPIRMLQAQARDPTLMNLSDSLRSSINALVGNWNLRPPSGCPAGKGVQPTFISFKGPNYWNVLEHFAVEIHLNE
jgi:hypothetical protein